MIRRISQAKARVAEIDTEMRDMQVSELYKLKVRLDEAKNLGRNVLDEMAASVNAQIVRAKARLAKTGPAPAIHGCARNISN